MTPEDGTDRLSQTVGNKLPLLAANTPEERRSYLLRGGRLQPSHITDYLHRQTYRQLLLAIYFLFILLHSFFSSIHFYLPVFFSPSLFLPHFSPLPLFLLALLIFLTFAGLYLLIPSYSSPSFSLFYYKAYHHHHHHHILRSLS